MIEEKTFPVSGSHYSKPEADFVIERFFAIFTKHAG